MRKSARSAFIGVSFVVILIIGFIIFYPVGPKEIPPAGFTAFRDDALALRYLPVFNCPPEFGTIATIYYRASREDSGLIRVAYHPVWAKERNDTKAWKPFLSRWLYTGGLSLQRAMFGKGDVESVGISIDPGTGSILDVEYETAADYSAFDFSVKHEKVRAAGPYVPPLRFNVVTWNHLFSLAGPQENPVDHTQTPSNPPLSYFTPRLWNEYAMWKNPETILRKNRAHFTWERATSP